MAYEITQVMSYLDAAVLSSWLYGCIVGYGFIGGISHLLWCVCSRQFGILMIL